MSLKIWLPLDGNVENKGTHNATITLSGATVDTAGKIGSCYSFDGTDDYIQLTDFTPNGWAEFSLAAWVYPTADFNALFLIRGSGAHRINVNANGFVFRDTNNSTQRKFQFSPTIPLNTWTHIVCVYKRGEVWLYQNGVLSVHDSSYYNSSSTLLNDMNEIRIARQQSTSGNVYYTGKINDFRIYDHALSTAEVHELAQGLVRHYKMDDADNVRNENYLAITPANNVWTYPIFDTSSAAGGWSHWGPSGSSHTHGQNTDKTYIYNKSQTYSHYFSENEGTGKYYMCYKTGAFAGGFRSIHCILKGQNNENPQGKIVATCNSFVSGGAPLEAWTSIKYLGDGFYYCKWEGFKQSEATSTASLVGFSVFSGYKFYISEAYIENSETCTSLFSNNTSIQDSSGYGKHGTIVGTTTIDNISPRYYSSTHMDNTGTSNHISAEALPSTVQTVSLWVKSGTSNQCIFAARTCSLAFGFISGNINTKAGTADTVTGFTSSNYSTTDWNHIVVTFDGTNRKVYINGVSQSSVSTKNYFTHQVDDLWFGQRRNSSSSTTYGMDASISDFRAYVTLLSEDDIKELYRVGLKIDKRSGMHTYELQEGQNQLRPTAQGLLQCEHLEEDEKASFYKDKHIEASQIIEM